MSTDNQITAGDIASAAEEILAVASALDPRVALAVSGYEALKNLFSKTGKLNTMMSKVYAETEESAPAVAQEVSAYFTDQGEAMLKSFRDHPGK